VDRAELVFVCNAVGIYLLGYDNNNLIIGIISQSREGILYNNFLIMMITRAHHY